MSYWSHPKPVERARAVDVERVGVAAKQLLDHGGVGALTVRAVAQRLDVAPASLYSRLSTAEDLLDLALDHALGCDDELATAHEQADLHALMLALYRHLVRHPWACQVIIRRTPRGPHYLRLSERMCVLLLERGSPDPLGDAYALSNFVLGSAATASSVSSELEDPVDARLAPKYASLHEFYQRDPESVLVAGLEALLPREGA